MGAYLVARFHFPLVKLSAVSMKLETRTKVRIFVREEAGTIPVFVGLTAELLSVHRETNRTGTTSISIKKLSPKRNEDSGTAAVPATGLLVLIPPGKTLPSSLFTRKMSESCALSSRLISAMTEPKYRLFLCCGLRLLATCTPSR